MKHPEIFFGKSHEHAIIDLSNYYIVLGHLMCAAAEVPITVADGKSFFGDTCEGGFERAGEGRFGAKHFKRMGVLGKRESYRSRSLRCVELRYV